jgi:hypothetical protein
VDNRPKKCAIPPAMLRRFAMAANAVPTDADAQAVYRT